MDKTPNEPNVPENKPTPRELPTRTYPTPDTDSPSDPQDDGNR